MESTIQKTLDLLVKHIQGIENHKPGSRPSFELCVAFEGYGSDKKPTVRLACGFYDGSDYQTVKAASFGAVVDEVNRRLGFADRERSKLDEVERGLVALPSPKHYVGVIGPYDTTLLGPWDTFEEAEAFIYRDDLPRGFDYIQITANDDIWASWNDLVPENASTWLTNTLLG